MNTVHQHAVILSALVLLGLAACTPGAATQATPTAAPLQPAAPAILPEPGAPGTLQTSACRFVLPDDIFQGRDVDCYYLTVKEQREQEDSDSTGRVIRLPIAVFHPPGGASLPDPVIYLSGGPKIGVLEILR